MTDEAVLVATWWGVAIAGFVGFGGLITGIVGLVQASRAKSSAASANVIAKDANAVSRQANTFAAEANSISRDANSLSEEALAVTKGEAQRANELHRIDWDLNWGEPGQYRVINLGPDAAVGLHAQITVDDETVVGEAERLETGEALVLEFPGALATYKREERERVQDRQWMNSQKKADLYGSPMPNLPFVSRLSPLHGSDHFIRDLLHWRSPAGNPQKHDKRNTMCRLSY